MLAKNLTPLSRCPPYALLVFLTEVSSFTCTFQVFWSVASGAAITRAFFDARCGFLVAKGDAFKAAIAASAVAADAFVFFLGAMVE